MPKDKQLEHPLDTLKKLLQYCDKSFSRHPDSFERKLLNDAHIAYQGLNCADILRFQGVIAMDFER